MIIASTISRIFSGINIKGCDHLVTPSFRLTHFDSSLSMKQFQSLLFILIFVTLLFSAGFQSEINPTVRPDGVPINCDSLITFRLEYGYDYSQPHPLVELVLYDQDTVGITIGELTDSDGDGVFYLRKQFHQKDSTRLHFYIRVTHKNTIRYSEPQEFRIFVPFTSSQLTSMSDISMAIDSVYHYHLTSLSREEAMEMAAQFGNTLAEVKDISDSGNSIWFTLHSGLRSAILCSAPGMR